MWHIRGGLSGINLNSSGNPVPNSTEKDLFSYKLEYETAGQWGGNIGKQSWNHVNGTTPVGIRSYTYTYDTQSRLKTATYSGIGSENYSIPNVNYSKNGNITQLQRNGKTGGSFGLMDNLSYTYSGNRLTSVNDGVSGNNEVDFVKRGSGGYTYYANGALKSDENEEIINIVYNTYLNLPEEITLSGGRWIKYTYDGDGQLLKTEYSTGEYWEYVDGSGGVPLVFKNGQPYRVSVPDGRAINESGVWKLEFDYKDHLGNTRVSFKEGSSGVVQTARTDFDPWGVRLNGTGTVNAYQNRWELQGKEKESTFNLNRVDFGARVYNPTIGRWDRTDPLAEFFPGINPYAYAINNPVLFNDRFGLFPSFGIMECPTCPKGAEYDVYRDSPAFFTYKDGFVYNGAGTDVIVRSNANNSSVTSFLYEFTMGASATTEYYLGKRLENLAKWEGTHRYGGAKNVFSQADIEIKAISRKPLLKTRPVNIISQYTLPRPQALKLVKGLKLAGNITAGYTILSTGQEAIDGEISTAHALTTVGLTVAGGVAATFSAPVAIPAIIIMGLYGYYEDDIWHDFDKQNAANFKE